MRLVDLAGSDKAVGIACRLDNPKAIEIARELSTFLVERKVQVYSESRISHLIGHLGKSLYEMTRDRIPVVICVGGDGTILRVAQKLPYKNPPAILGVNVGAVGFLAEYDMPARESFPQLVETNFFEERTTRLTCHIEDHNLLPPVLNEVLVITSRPSKALNVTIKVNDQLYSSGYVDGIIISTPTGSTAYCLSAGGAIMIPDLEAIQIVPVCPFARTGLKPIILKPDATVEIELLRPKLNAVITIDGQQEFSIPASKKITIKRSSSSMLFWRSRRNSFFERLSRKLLPGAQFPVPKDDQPEE